jgi:hypothetical protein
MAPLDWSATLSRSRGVLPNRTEGSKAATPMIAPDVTGTERRWTAEDVRDRVYGRTGPNKPGVGLARWPY